MGSFELEWENSSDETNKSQRQKQNWFLIEVSILQKTWFDCKWSCNGVNKQLAGELRVTAFEIDLPDPCLV